MWYEILPSAAIIAGSLAFPTIGVLIMNRIFYHSYYRRRLEFLYERRFYQRDGRLTGWPYTQNGLEVIGDDDDDDDETDKETDKDCSESICNIQPVSYQIPATPLQEVINSLVNKNEDAAKTPIGNDVKSATNIVASAQTDESIEGIKPALVAILMAKTIVQNFGALTKQISSSREDIAISKAHGISLDNDNINLETNLTSTYNVEDIKRAVQFTENQKENFENTNLQHSSDCESTSQTLFEESLQLAELKGKKKDKVEIYEKAERC